jgi:hypothetical protein
MRAYLNSGIVQVKVIDVARPVSRARLASGKAALQVYMDADLRDRLARAAFEAGVPVSSVVSRAVRAELDRADAPSPSYEAPRARWIELGPTAGWAARGAACPASSEGALVEAMRAAGDERWHAFVRAAGAVVAVGSFRSLTAAMLEAEREAASLTVEEAKATVRAAARREGRRRS